ADTNPAEGNVLEDDALGSTYTKFLVDDGTGNFIEVTDGTPVVGDYGTLTINADGSYSYQPNSDLGDIGGVDEFTYRLEHPNGTVSDATLTIEVEHGDGPYDPSVAPELFLSEGDLDFDQFDESGSDIDASSTAVSKASFSEDILSDDGEEADLSGHLDRFLSEIERPEDDASSDAADNQETETSPRAPASEEGVNQLEYLQTSVDDLEQSLPTHQPL